MKVTESQFDLGSLLISPEQSLTRTDGVHVSAVVRKLSLAMGKRDNDFTEEQLNAFATVGRLFERVLEDTLFGPPRYERIGELEHDGIIGSPDSIDTDEWAVCEFKVRFCNSRDFQGRREWLEILYQVKSYCAMVGTPRARVLILFIRELPPLCMEYHLLFTPQELAENWNVIKVNSKGL